MIPYTQKQLHNPEAGVKGDCFRTSLACLMHVEPTSVPLFHDSTWRADVQAWLKPFGMALYDLPANGDLPLPWQMEAKHVYHGLSGPSPRDPGIQHMVVAMDGQMVHDPHPSRSGLSGTVDDWRVWLLVKL